MKVLLLQNIRKVGQKGQIVDVSEGYGRNFLINRGLAKIATGSVLKSAESQKQNQQAQAENKKEENLKQFVKVNKSKFEITGKANEKGHLFAGIHKTQIAELVGLEEENILLDSDLKEVGEIEIKINVEEKKGKFTLEVKGV